MISTSPFTMPLSIQAEDIDALGHVNNVVYLRWVQEVAAAHWSVLAKNATVSEAVWVVLRHEIDYLKAAQPDDKLLARTWVGTTDRLRSIRHVQIETVAGTILAKAQTTWCMVHPATGQVQRISPEVLALLQAL
jgi:acyl-CoA thioester hydrolase